MTLTPSSAWAEAARRDAQYLTRLDGARLLCLHTAAANLTGNFSAPTCSPYGHPQYFGHYLGHWLSATAMLASQEHLADSAAAREASAAAVARLAQCQAAWTSVGHDGYLFPYSPVVFDALEEGINCKPTCVPFYVMHKMLAGLLDQSSLADNQQAFDMAVALAGWVQRYVESVLTRRGQSQWQVCNPCNVPREFFF